jgi:sterol desaturase/sphingolipid hydroxylase (fatty acid hydroxylase superfamily)
VVGEFGFYSGHRWSHAIPFLWRFHVIHHSATAVDWLTSTRGHPVDIIFTRLCGFGLVYLAGLAQVGAATGSLVVSLAAIFTTLWGFFIHANLKWRMGWLEAVVSTPAFHRWHHTNDEHRDHNYASTLPIYDRLFGTLYLPRSATAPVHGSDTAMPDGIIDQLLSPLIRQGTASAEPRPRPGPAVRS